MQPESTHSARTKPEPATPPSHGRLSALVRMGLEGKLIVGFSLLLLLAMTVSSWLSVKKSRETLSDIIGEETKQIAQMLAMAACTPYHQNDLEELHRLGQDLIRNRNIVLVAFFDPSGKPLAMASRDPDATLQRMQLAAEVQSGPQNLMKVSQRHMDALGEFLQVTAPVLDVFHGRGPGKKDTLRSGTSLLGYLTIGVSQNEERAQLQRVNALAVGVGVLIFILTLPLASALIHRIFLPIRQLVTATNRIAAGKYDTRVATHRPDVIGSLARAFNEMIIRIKQHEQELKIANGHLATANRDLEERVHQRTQELEASNQRLSAEIAEKEEFLRTVSHDLNAPLRNIGGMATMLLLKHRDHLDQEIVHRLDRICKNVEVETGLIAEILELSRIKTRRQKLEAVDTRAMVQDLADVFEEDLKEKQITLLVEGDLPVITCERARIRQVFQNLIDNAIKYMGPGAAREIHVGGHDAGAQVEFYVRDTGLGIDPEDIQKVFHIFRRGKNTAEANVPGKGVGLASVKSIIEAHEGRIWVESVVGKGSTFRFSMPRRSAAEAPSPDRQAA